MPQLPKATRRYLVARQARVKVTSLAVRGEFRKLGKDWDKGFKTVGPRIAVILRAAQRGAAAEGANYVGLVLAETGQRAPLTVRPNTDALSWQASDGRPLMGLVYGGVTHAKAAVASGTSPVEALAFGERYLDLVSVAQVVDAATGGSALARVCRYDVTGYVRTLSGPSCIRCAVLAGKFFKYNRGFDRHPRCDCEHIPATEGFSTKPWQVDVDAAYAQGAITKLTKAEVKSIDAGADIASIVNSRRVNQFNRSLGHTRVEDIISKDMSRDETVAILKEYGFIY